MDPKFEIFIFLIIIAFDLYQFIQMYIIRKTKNSTKITGWWVSSILIPLWIMTWVMLISSIIALIKEIKHIPTDNYEGSPITGIIVWLIFIPIDFKYSIVFWTLLNISLPKIFLCCNPTWYGTLLSK